MAKSREATTAPARPQLDTEVANRMLDPFESSYLGVLRTNDPLLLERGNAGVELYRDLRRDGKVFSSLQKRTLALISRQWQAEPVTAGGSATDDAQTLTDILKACSFDQICRDLMEALLTGFAVCEIVWTVRDGKIVPARVVKRAQRRFVYVQEDPNLPPALRLLTRENMLSGIELPERKFIVHCMNPEDDNPYGMGLGLQLYWPVFFKRKGIVAWNKLNDRFGTPTPWGKYPNNAGQKEKGTLFDALRAISSDGVVMTPEGMHIELLESRLSGSITTQQSLCEYMDDWIDAVVLGTEARSKGGGALAAASKERQDVRLDLVQADSDLLSETINSTLVRWICEYNGLAPCLVYRIVKEEDDLKLASETDKNVADMGFELSLDAVRAKYGEGWEKPVMPPAPGPSSAPTLSPASFAELAASSGQLVIDQAIAAMPDDAFQEAMAGLIEPLLAAIDAEDTFEDALAAAEAAYPAMDKAKLQHLLARAMFGGEAYGRQVEQ